VFRHQRGSVMLKLRGRSIMHRRDGRPYMLYGDIAIDLSQKGVSLADAPLGAMRRSRSLHSFGARMRTGNGGEKRPDPPPRPATVRQTRCDVAK